MAINGAVPQPGATLPYSEFKGFNKVPKGVVIAVSTGTFFDTFDVPVAIICKKPKIIYFLEYENTKKSLKSMIYICYSFTKKRNFKFQN